MGDFRVDRPSLWVVVEDADAQPTRVRTELFDVRTCGRRRDHGVADARAARRVEQAAVSRTVRLTQCSTDSSLSSRTGPSVMRPWLGLSPTRPQQDAGMRIDPPPSLAWANGTIPERPRRPHHRSIHRACASCPTGCGSRPTRRARWSSRCRARGCWCGRRAKASSAAEKSRAAGHEFVTRWGDGGLSYRQSRTIPRVARRNPHAALVDAVTANAARGIRSATAGRYRSRKGSGNDGVRNGNHVSTDQHDI